MFRVRVVALSVLLIVGTATSAASGGEGNGDEKRAVPDYDGRGERSRRGSTAVDAAWWAPRLLFSPLYLTSEFLVRRPLGFMVRAAGGAGGEDNHRSWGIAPMVVGDWGLGPWIGVHFHVDGVGAENNSLRAYAGIGGPRTLLAGVGDRVTIGGRLQGWELLVRAEGSRRDDDVFHGIGSRTLAEDRSRFASDRVDAGVLLTSKPGALMSFGTSLGTRAVDVRSPENLAIRYALVNQQIAISIDTRRESSADGVRLAVDEESAFDLAHRREWLRFGVSGSTWIDLNGRRRVVGVTLSAMFVDPIAGGSPPFTELVALGGDGAMRGYLRGRLVNRSALIAAVHYEWPVWVWLDGFVMGELGNVFDAHLQNFAPRLLRVSATTGLRARGSSVYFVEIVTGVGSETIADGARVTSFRFLVASTHRL